MTGEFVGHSVWGKSAAVAIEAIGGGYVDLSNVHTIRHKNQILSTGTGSVVDLSSLQVLDGEDHRRSDTTSVTVADGGAVLADNLTTIRTASLFANDGLTLSLPSVTSYLGPDSGGEYTIQANGTGSLIDLSAAQTVTGSSARLYIKVINAGTIDLSGVETIDGAISIDALAGGQLFLKETGATTVSGAVPVTIDATSVVSADTLRLSGSAALSGTGTVDADLLNEGVVSPGSGLGSLTVTGDYTQCTEGALNIEVGGYDAGTEHDQLNVTGHAQLCGTLDVSLTSGFVPSLGDSFEVLTFASASSDFHTKSGMSLGGGLTFATAYSSGSMLLQVVEDQPPVVSALSASPDPVGQGADLTLTASGGGRSQWLRRSGGVLLGCRQQWHLHHLRRPSARHRHQ